MLNRFLSSKLEKEGGGRGKKRPYLASECRDLNECDRWRSEILRDIGKKVMDIQNAGLGEHRLRDLNDGERPWPLPCLWAALTAVKHFALRD